MNTLDTNKLIAQFMGWEFGRYQHLPNKCYKGEFNTDSEVGFDISQSKYHYSWDALMPVVEQINSLPSFFGSPNNFEVVIGNGYTVIKSEEDSNWTSGDIFGMGNTSIEITYDACVKFIQWYNQQKQ